MYASHRPFGESAPYLSSAAVATTANGSGLPTSGKCPDVPAVLRIGDAIDEQVSIARPVTGAIREVGPDENLLAARAVYTQLV